MEATDGVITEILATHGYTVEEAEGILNNAGRAIYQAGRKELATWVKTHLIKMRGIPVGYLIIGDELEAKLEE